MKLQKEDSTACNEDVQVPKVVKEKLTKVSKSKVATAAKAKTPTVAKDKTLESAKPKGTKEGKVKVPKVAKTEAPATQVMGLIGTALLLSVLYAWTCYSVCIRNLLHTHMQRTNT